MKDPNTEKIIGYIEYRRDEEKWSFDRLNDSDLMRGIVIGVKLALLNELIKELRNGDF